MRVKAVAVLLGHWTSRIVGPRLLNDKLQSVGDH